MVQVTRKPSGPMGQMEMEKGTTGTRDTLAIGSHSTDAEGPSEDFYDELQASRMSNCRSHRYTSDGESTVWISMMKRRSLQIKYCSSQMCN